MKTFGADSCATVLDPQAPEMMIRVGISNSHSAKSHATCFLSIKLPMIEDSREAEDVFVVQLEVELTRSHEWTFNCG